MEIKPVVTKADQRAALKEIESLMSARPEHPRATDRYPGDIGRSQGDKTLSDGRIVHYRWLALSVWWWYHFRHD